jgi:haloalkane dehalogenase
MATGDESRPSWVPRAPLPVRQSLPRHQRVAGALPRRGHRAGADPAARHPTWSFLYRAVIAGLRDRYRCIAVDYPGFGLSRAATDYGYTPAEHAQVVEDLVVGLDLRDATLMVQDWGGPIGFAVATRHPDRFSAFVIGSTWAWPKSDFGTQLFSGLLGGPLGGWLILQRNFFVERIIPAVMNAYPGGRDS